LRGRGRACRTRRRSSSTRSRRWPSRDRWCVQNKCPFSVVWPWVQPNVNLATCILNCDMVPTWQWSDLIKGIHNNVLSKIIRILFLPVFPITMVLLIVLFSLLVRLSSEEHGIVSDCFSLWMLIWQRAFVNRDMIPTWQKSDLKRNTQQCS